jgi:hypothetical protein
MIDDLGKAPDDQQHGPKTIKVMPDLKFLMESFEEEKHSEENQK